MELTYKFTCEDVMDLIYTYSCEVISCDTRRVYSPWGNINGINLQIYINFTWDDVMDLIHIFILRY